jgi:hypothetical protein
MVRTSPEGGFDVWDMVHDRALLHFDVDVPSYAHVDRAVMDGKGELILLAMSDATGALVTAHDGHQLHRLQRPVGPAPHMAYTRGAALSDDGTLAALGVWSDCFVFCTRTGALIRAFPFDHPSSHYDLFPRTWKGRLASKLFGRLMNQAGGRDFNKLIPARSHRTTRVILGRLPQPIPFMGAEITGLDISGCNRYLFAATESHVFREWEIATGKLVCDNWTPGCLEKNLPAFHGRGGPYGYQCDVRADASFRPAALRSHGVLVEGFRYHGVTFYDLSPPYTVLGKRTAGDGQILAAGVLDGQPLVIRLDENRRIEILRDIPRIPQQRLR